MWGLGLTFKQQLKLLGCCLALIPIGSWVILYQAVIPLLENDGTELNIVYYYSGIFVLQTSVALYSFILLYYKRKSVSASVFNKVNMVAMIIIISTTCAGCIMLGYGKYNTIKGIGLIFIMAPSPSYLTCGMAIIVPSILKTSPPELIPKQMGIAITTLLGFFNLMGIMVSIISLAGLTLQEACIITFIGSIASGIYFILNIDVPENICDDIDTKKIFDVHKNTSKIAQIVLILTILISMCSVIVPWMANYNHIVASALDIDIESDTVKDIIELYINWWVWVGPLSILIINKIVEFRFGVDIMFEIYMGCIIISLVCIGISNEIALIIWGIINPSLPVAFFGFTAIIFIQQYKGGILVNAIVLALVGLINYTSILKNNIYDNTEGYLILIMIEGSITLLISLILYWVHNKDVKKLNDENQKKLSYLVTEL